MPFGDGTGPNGFGPMSGRAAGYCAGYDVPGYANPVPGRGYGRGAGRGFGRGFGGRGRGWRHGAPGWGRPAGGYSRQAFYGAVVPPPPGVPVGDPTAEQELELLKNQARYLEETLKNIVGRIDELENKAPEE